MGAECAGVHTISPLAVCLGEARTWHSWAQGQPAATWQGWGAALQGEAWLLAAFAPSAPFPQPTSQNKTRLTVRAANRLASECGAAFLWQHYPPPVVEFVPSSQLCWCWRQNDTLAWQRHELLLRKCFRCKALFSAYWKVTLCFLILRAQPRGEFPPPWKWLWVLTSCWGDDLAWDEGVSLVKTFSMFFTAGPFTYSQRAT